MSGDYFVVNISVDSLGWTNHWLKDRRCDLLCVAVACRPEVTPRVRITAVESKSNTGEEPMPLSADQPPFTDAIEQVVATLEALSAFLDPQAGQTLIADLKLSSLFEHLASEILAQIAPIQPSEVAKLFILEALSALSKRELPVGHQLVLDGLVVVTQRDVNVSTKHAKIDFDTGERRWPVRLVRCGIPALRDMFEEAGMPAVSTLASAPASEPGAGSSSSVPPGSAPCGSVPSGSVPSGSVPSGSVPSGSVPSGSAARSGASSQGLSSDDAAGASAEGGGAAALSASVTTATAELLERLETACRLRRFPIDSIDPALAQEGPTLVTVPVALQAGEKIAPIIQATSDLARELGVPSVVVENDPSRPYHIRFLLPRSDRQCPRIPVERPVAEAEHYLPLWLGAEVDGKPFRSHVSEWPHLLVAGTTGSGKTTFLRSLLIQTAMDEDSRVIVVDGKGEFDYVDLVPPAAFVHEFPDVLLGHENVVPVLEWLVNSEVSRRRDALRDYFRRVPSAPRAPRQAYVVATAAKAEFPLRPIVVFVDEFAEIMLAAGPAARSFEDLVQRVVQAGRSALVHLVLATQRPDANVLRGAIKANLPSRVALALPSHHDSMTVLNAPGAEELLGKGDLYFQASTVERVRLQGYMPPL